MKTLKNESGYSLLSALLIITIFTIIFLAFVGYSFTTSKQNTTVEKQSKSVAFAEMGINYVEAAINDIYKSNKDDIDDEILAEMKSDVTDKDYTDLALDKMKTCIEQGLEDLFNLEENTFLNNSVPNPIYVKSINSDISNPNIIIRDFNLIKNSTDDKITISFVSEGKNVGGDNVQLQTEMEITITENEENDGGIHVGVVLPKFNSIIAPSGGYCDFPKNCDGLLIKPAAGLLESVIEFLTTITDNINNTVNKTIFSTKGITLNGNLNSTESLKLHAVERILINDNMNNSNNLVLETLSNLTLNGNTDFLGNSTLYIGKSLTNNKHLNLTGDTVAFVEENLNINDKFNMSSNAKMCVKNNINIKDLSYITIDSDLGLIVKNKVFVNGRETTEQIAGIKTSENNWEELCECQIPYTWAKDISNNVDYQY